MAGRPCKVCGLEESYPEAFRLISREIKKEKGKAKIKKLLNTLKKRFNLDINGVNIYRHKTHLSSNIHEIRTKDISKTGKQKETFNEGVFLNNPANTITFPDLDPQHAEYLMHYRANWYKNKEDAAKLAGFKDPKKIYEVMKRPEIKAALNEMRAIDFINLKITGNQIIAGLGKVANYTDYIDQMYDEDGNPITNIRKWPEELRCALNAVEMTEDVMKSIDGDEDGNGAGVILKRKFKFRFESHLKAKQELRKHFMEIQMYQQGGDNSEKMKIYENIIEKLLLNQINPIAAGLEMGKYNLTVPDALRIAMQKVDPNVLDKPPLIDLDDMDDYSDEELERIASGDID
ncbi:hypothetical protein KAR91_27835 [Candidatus Pacearchaeota archaeon]|nr:hypothetical protein [Candidatus Pacearchaeota archaeon]